MREPHSNNSVGRAGGGSQWRREAEREGRAEVVVVAAAAVRDGREEEGGMREDAVRARGGKDRGNHEWRSAAWLPRIPQRRASSILCGAARIHLRRRRRRNRLDERRIEGRGDARA